MTTSVKTGSETQPGELAGHEMPYSLTQLAAKVRNEVVWLTDAELEAMWRRDELAAPAGALLTAAGCMPYSGGNGGDESFIPVNVMRGYD